MQTPPRSHCPPHKVRPLLPVSWHARVRTFCADVDTLSAVLELDIRVLIVEDEFGGLSVSARADKTATDEARALLQCMCNRAMDAVGYICVICGELGGCYQANRTQLLFICCIAHSSRDPASIRRGPMPPIDSPWRGDQKISALTLIATSELAAGAVLSFYDRHDDPILSQILAEAETLRARIAIDLITNTSEA